MKPEPNLTPPRYARRHWNAATLTDPKTRRQRRMKTRILRVMQVSRSALRERLR